MGLTFFLVAGLAVAGLILAAGGVALLAAVVSAVVLALRWRGHPRLRGTQLVITALIGVAGLALLVPPVWWFGSLGAEVASSLLVNR